MGEAGAGVCGAELCVLEEAIEVGPSICEAWRRASASRWAARSASSFASRSRMALSAGFGRDETGGDGGEDSCWLAEMTLRR